MAGFIALSGLLMAIFLGYFSFAVAKTGWQLHFIPNVLGSILMGAAALMFYQYATNDLMREQFIGAPDVPLKIPFGYLAASLIWYVFCIKLTELFRSNKVSSAQK